MVKVDGTGGNGLSVPILREVFRRLASFELDSRTAWAGPADEPELRLRIGLLGVLFDLIPRAELERLGELISAWHAQLGSMESIALGDVKAVVRKVLRDDLAGFDRSSGSASNWERAWKVCRLADGDGIDTGPGTTFAEVQSDRNGAELWRGGSEPGSIN